MPLALLGRTKDAVVSVPARGAWRDGVATFLGSLSDDREKVARHLSLLDERAAGRLRWSDTLAGASLPNGRPLPPSRRYAQMLVREELLPLYDLETLRFSLDLHNPCNEAGVTAFDPDLLDLAIVADIGSFAATTPGTLFDTSLPEEEIARQRAVNGGLLGDLVARLAEATGAPFAYADISATGWIADAATRTERVVHPAPSGVRPWDFLWSITVWGPSLLDASLSARLDGLLITDEMRQAMDPVERRHTRIERRRLASGALFLQYRFLFGSELRSSRSACDTPLAHQAGLRSTNLQFRT